MERIAREFLNATAAPAGRLSLTKPPPTPAEVERDADLIVRACRTARDALDGTPFAALSQHPDIPEAMRSRSGDTLGQAVVREAEIARVEDLIEDVIEDGRIDIEALAEWIVDSPELPDHLRHLRLPSPADSSLERFDPPLPGIAEWTLHPSFTGIRATGPMPPASTVVVPRSRLLAEHRGREAAERHVEHLLERAEQAESGDRVPKPDLQDMIRSASASASRISAKLVHLEVPEG